MNLSNGDGIEAYFCNKYIYYTRVQNFLFVDQKPFLNWVHVYVRYAKSFLHPPLSEVIVVLLFLHHLYEMVTSQLADGPTRQRIKSSRDVGELVVNPIQLIRS